jgi:hypothetical protein
MAIVSDVVIQLYSWMTRLPSIHDGLYVDIRLVRINIDPDEPDVDIQAIVHNKCLKVYNILFLNVTSACGLIVDFARPTMT